jgi:hypothetical protein
LRDAQDVTTGTRWARVTDIIQYATLQWPAVQERIAKRKESPGEVAKVVGKRKSSGGGSSKASKARLSASAGLSDEQHKKDMAEKLCHICHQPGHHARQCFLHRKDGKLSVKMLLARTSCPRRIFRLFWCR